jgi:prepilin-type N-terminal cleavage/methylation domain-containing protein
MGQEMIFVILTLIYPVKRCDWLRLTMKRKQNKIGVTLVEMLVVVAIIAILVAMVIGVASRINTQGKEQLTENTIAILTAALGQFRDYGYTYSAPPDANFKFPLDCNGFSDTDLETELKASLGVTTVSVTSIGHDPNYSGCEVLYFFLNRVPDCRGALDKIDKSLVTNKGSNDQDMIITVDGKDYPLFRVIDSWGETLQYSYYRNMRESSPSSEPDPCSPRTFPLIISAGPDKKFDSTDDITSRD